MFFCGFTSPYTQGRNKALFSDQQRLLLGFCVRAWDDDEVRGGDVTGGETFFSFVWNRADRAHRWWQIFISHNTNNDDGQERRPRTTSEKGVFLLPILVLYSAFDS
jgi:hypothetical protein